MVMISLIPVALSIGLILFPSILAQVDIPSSTNLPNTDEGTGEGSGDTSAFIPPKESHYCPEDGVQNVTETDTVPCINILTVAEQGWEADTGKSVYTDDNGVLTCHVFRIVEKAVIIEVCCDGWMGGFCEEAICEPECLNGGKCIEPGTCSCPVEYEGARCQDKIEIIVDPLPTGSTNLGQRTLSTCVSWNGDHYRTFDGTHFTFNGQCTYTLAADKDGLWSILEKNVDCDNVNTCHKRIEILLNFDELIIERGLITFNSEPVTSFPFFISGISLSVIGDFTFMESSLGVTAKWDATNTIYVTLLQDLLNTAVGLCGTYDNDPSNDFTLKNGEVTTVLSQFGNSWEAAVIGEVCTGLGSDHPCVTHPERVSTAEELCAVITASEFKQCSGTVEYTPYLDACIYDVCAWGNTNDDMMEILCDVLQAYVRECTMENIILDWRSEQFCPKECPGLMEYKECGSRCKRNCATKNMDLGLHCSPECVSGCECPEGYVEEKGKCIEVEDCPCIYNKKEYVAGDVIQIKCNNCTCDSGEWTCTNDVCKATCSVFGDPHYVTFDQKYYTFQGDCDYVLAEDYIDGKFSVIVNNKECGNSYSLTCTRSAVITISNTVVTLNANLEVLVNGQLATMPYENADLAIVQPSSMFVVVHGYGLRVEWDGVFRLYVTVQPSFMNKLRGLCGTYDFNQNNDFMTPEGDVEASKIQFANKFKTNSNCPDLEESLNVYVPCNFNKLMRSFAEEKCAIVYQDIFKPCHGFVSVEMYYDACMYDVCGCETDKTNECLCGAVSAYARECANAGAPVFWREHELVIDHCAIQCEGNSIYSECSRGCGRTCHQLAFPCFKDDFCVAGCVCPDGQAISDNGECVPYSACYCTFEDQTYPPGAELERPCMTCVCTNGTFECDGEECADEVQCPNNLVYSQHASPCPKTCRNYDNYQPCSGSTRSGCECPENYVLAYDTCVLPENCPCLHGGIRYNSGETMQPDACNTCTCHGRMWDCTTEQCSGTCSVVGEGHFSTFDGRMYTFAGPCQYILAEEVNQAFSIDVTTVLCGSSGITCTRAIDIHIGNITVFMVRGSDITVNNVPITLPKYYGNLRIEQSGLFYIVTSDLGLRVKWDGGTRLYVTIEPQFNSKVKGLCGDFNGDQINDYSTRTGLVVQSPDNFANSWQVLNNCPDVSLLSLESPCEVHPQRKTWAMRHCSIILHTTFAECHALVEPNSYFERCTYDACG
ncbi:SCO-spondin-like [Anneissia japonica]|uniref:SCO-spondin-like n=1 Tax=Anneissia japonica TaxID=1529436 RepID=UPI00142595A2|nr:SCO-spondin-like [Anneissia japonica]